MKEITLRNIRVIPMMKIGAIFYAILGIITGALWTIRSLNGVPGTIPFGTWAVLIMPVVNGVLGGVFGLIISALYNLLTRWIGGLKFAVSSSDET